MHLPDIRLFFRSLKRETLYSVITIGGFAFALSFVIILSIYIKQELSVDQFHEKKDRIFRATSEDSSHFGSLIGGELQNMFPEIEKYTRTHAEAGFIIDKEQRVSNFSALFADSTFFDIFSFKLLEGNFSEVLKTKNSVVLTESSARKLFGNESSLGKVLGYKIDSKVDLIVTGIMEDFPNNTHFAAQDGIVNIGVIPELWNYPSVLSHNSTSSFGLYFLARPNVNLHAKTPEILEYFKENFWLYRDGFYKEFYFQPLTDIYFGGKSSNQGMKSNSKGFVLMLSAIAVVILILALINYNNLSVARIGVRSKESAIKKLLGTNNRYLFRQIITESLILGYISFMGAIIISILTIPLFNKLLNTSLSLFEYVSFFNILFILLLVTCLGIIAGLIPAYMITRFKPVEVVKGVFRRKSKGIYGKSLIAFQYAVTIVLLIATFVIVKQTHFMKNYDLGFDKENVIILDYVLKGEQYSALRSEFEKLPGVEKVSFVSGTPIDGGNNWSFKYNDKALSFQLFEIDSAFFELMNIKVIPTGIAYTSKGIWLNQQAVKELELEELPLEATIRGSVHPVMGVVEDFHFAQLTEQISPAYLAPIQDIRQAWSILLKIRGDNLKQNFDDVKKVYSDFVKGEPFKAEFMDQTINSWYVENERNAQLIGYFAVLTIILAVMGLLAMAAYFIQQRVKEIGIRRVNGAMIGEVFSMLVVDFIKWVLVAFIIACPIGWYFMNQWLSDFPYRTDIGIWVFVLAGSVVGIIALVIIGWQSLKVAFTNPVESLKTE